MLNNIVENPSEKQLFQVMFLKNDKFQSVQVEEVAEIDFAKIQARLEKGESIFISNKCIERQSTNSCDKKKALKRNRLAMLSV